jgi:hypothetical protein
MVVISVVIDRPSAVKIHACHNKVEMSNKYQELKVKLHRNDPSAAPLRMPLRAPWPVACHDGRADRDVGMIGLLRSDIFSDSGAVVTCGHGLVSSAMGGDQKNPRTGPLYNF